MKTPTRTECMVCYEEKFMSPCGSQRDCNVYICRDCKVNTSNSPIDGAFVDACYICKIGEYKDGISYEMFDVVKGDSTDYTYLNKVLRNVRLNHGIGWIGDESDEE